MKTIKQIADDLGVSKQKVYRYIKNNGIQEVQQESNQRNNVKYYDDVAENLIRQAFIVEMDTSGTDTETSHTHINDILLKQIEILQRELEVKNNQIESLNKLLENQQKLSAMNQKKVDELEQKEVEEPQKKWWKIW